MEPSLFRSINEFLHNLAVDVCFACPEAAHIMAGNFDWKIYRGNREVVISMTMRGDKIGMEVSCWEDNKFNKDATTWFLCTTPTSKIVTYIEGWLKGERVS